MIEDIGFFVNHFIFSNYVQHGKEDYYTYHGWWSVWWTGTYSMVLSKAAFFNKKYLRLYTNEMPASIKEFVTKNRFVLYLVFYLATVSVIFIQWLLFFLILEWIHQKL